VVVEEEEELFQVQVMVEVVVEMAQHLAVGAMPESLQFLMSLRIPKTEMIQVYMLIRKCSRKNTNWHTFVV
jgi:hypothetical protein